MKLKHLLLILVLSFTLVFQNSCSTSRVTIKEKTKKGWTKNPNNPHHPRTTNPGHTKNKNKGKGKGKAKGHNKNKH